MTPQEYNLTATLVQGSATWRHFVKNFISNPSTANAGDYASMLSTTTQASAGTTSANLVHIDTVDFAQGISISGNDIVFSHAGNYLLNFLGQFKFSGGGTGGNITVWYTINGTPATNSAFTFYLPTSNNYQLLANVEDINHFNAGDRLNFYWWSDISPNANVSLNYVAAGTNPTRPASASVNITISQLG